MGFRALGNRPCTARRGLTFVQEARDIGLFVRILSPHSLDHLPMQSQHKRPRLMHSYEGLRGVDEFTWAHVEQAAKGMLRLPFPFLALLLFCSLLLFMSQKHARNDQSSSGIVGAIRSSLFTALLFFWLRRGKSDSSYRARSSLAHMQSSRHLWRRAGPRKGGR